LAKRNTSALREAVSEARKAGINVDDAKEVLEKLVKQEAARERLAHACQSNKEDKLHAAILSAREVDVDCAEAQQQLDTLMERRMADMLQQEEARAARREQLEAELHVSLCMWGCVAIIHPRHECSSRVAVA
jgi:siderophore synthetase component